MHSNVCCKMETGLAGMCEWAGSAERLRCLAWLLLLSRCRHSVTRLLFLPSRSAGPQPGLLSCSMPGCWLSPFSHTSYAAVLACLPSSRAKALPCSQELEPMLLHLSDTLASKGVPAGSRLSDAYIRAQSGERLVGCSAIGSLGTHILATADQVCL